MLFNTVQFFIFLAVVLAAFYALPWWNARKWLLLGASYYFYASWNPKFLLLLGTLTLVDYFCAICGNLWRRSRLRHLHIGLNG